MIVDQKSLPEPCEQSLPGSVGQAILALLRDANAKGVIHLGVNSSRVLCALRTESIPCIGLDSQANSAAGIYPLDATKIASQDAINALVAKLPGNGIAYLTTCFDTLQQIDRADVSKVIWNLRNICQETLIVSVPTRPSRDFNAYHATVIPRRTWLKLFEAAGLEEVPCNAFASRHLPADHPDDFASWSLNHWQKLNPYRDYEAGNHHTLVLRKKQNAPVTFEAFDTYARALLGVPTPNKLPLAQGTYVTFLLGHYQEFLLFQPFFDQLPTNQFRVLLRSGVYGTIPSGRVDSIEAYFQRRRIAYQHLTAIDQVNWHPQSQAKDILITAIDSTAVTNHRINAAIVAEARAQGIPTLQLQHGLWPHAEFQEPHTILCDHLLAWSHDFEKPFQLQTESATPDQPPRHSVHYVGCPRFDAYSDLPSIEIADLLGDWAASYEKSVVVATNLHWPLHSQGGEVLPQLFETAREMPETLFLCKLHPVHDFQEETFAEIPSNVMVIDEFVSLYGDLSTPRLIQACDAVVCTLSTVALEGALANKPVAILETGNPNRYEGMTTVPIACLTETVRNLLHHPVTPEQYASFIQHYYNGRTDGSSQTEVARVLDQVAAQAAPSRQGLELAVESLAHEFLQNFEACGRLRHELQQAGMTDHSSGPAAGQTDSEPGKERWRHLRKYLRSLQKRLPTFRSLAAPAPSPAPATPVNVPPQVAEALPASPVTQQTVAPVASSKRLTFGSLQSREEFPELLRQLGLNGLGIELGVAAGAYSDFLLEHSDLRILFSVDRWTDHHNDEEARQAHRLLARHSVRSSVLKMTFDEAIQLFADATFDFIFLDGYAHLGQDGIDTLTTWWHKLKPGGVFAGHDYHPEWPNTIDVVDRFTSLHGLELFTTDEDPSVVEHAYPSWYVHKPS
ncbi:class I SAM-dependent methyltransferase [Blastopirellula marina]|uniref:Uncharacterized protein n=1 Tax=Blastopirellula marina TaxID=124 RepID=A0A2S8FAB9_9BACT|nr:class I SAM-dependent methyltransferase [Blastopirellula marina]PQO28874.1 hypothetical protein C5Y98_24230 [Blastopirellula marina]PTL42147.1 hypothetical protein C5Y97_24245 [Blastopirellula marina]